MISIRRTLHRHPELSWTEQQTTSLIIDRLFDLGIRAQRIDGITGVIADIQGLPESPLIALRASIDAVLVQEESRFEFASNVKTCMHACAHDGHTAMLLGAARLLSMHQPLPISVRLIFQPAEELGTGAKALIDRGVLQDVAMIFSGHLDEHYRNGTIVVEPPYHLNDSDSVEIARKVAIELLGKKHVLDPGQASMGDQDFTCYLEKVAGGYVRFGAKKEEQKDSPAHSSRFDFDEHTLALGASFYYAVALAAGRTLSRTAPVKLKGVGNALHK